MRSGSKNGWRTADKKPVKNVDLWKRLDAALGSHQIRWHWVKGHAGHDMNERADVLAREAIAEIRGGSAFVGAGFRPAPTTDALQRLQQIIRARHLGLAGGILDVERLDHAVIDHHGVALRAHAEAAFGQVRR